MTKAQIYILAVAVGYAIGIPGDYALVATGHKTISAATWLAEKEHPTLTLGIFLIFAAGFTGMLVAMFSVQSTGWRIAAGFLAYVVAFTAGHLGTVEASADVVGRVFR